MIKVNLISRKRRENKGKNWTRLITFALFGSLCVYFLADTLYVLISISVLNSQLNNINKESTSISSVMLKNNEKLNRYVLTKLILSKIESVNNSRFKYKDYLDSISLLLPDGTTLGSIDFATKGWVTATVKSTDVFALKRLEDKIVDKTTWSSSNFFSSAYTESVSLDRTGTYNCALHLELKKSNAAK